MSREFNLCKEEYHLKGFRMDFRSYFLTREERAKLLALLWKRHQEVMRLGCGGWKFYDDSVMLEFTANASDRRIAIEKFPEVPQIFHVQDPKHFTELLKIAYRCYS